jgi:hypothetical protein
MPSYPNPSFPPPSHANQMDAIHQATTNTFSSCFYGVNNQASGKLFRQTDLFGHMRDLYSMTNIKGKLGSIYLSSELGLEASVT